MEKQKPDPSSTKEKKTRRKKECDIPDEQRCQRSDRKKNWRCTNARDNHIYCQHHIELTAKNYLARKDRKKQVPLNSCEENPEEGNESIATDATQAIEISKSMISDVFTIRNPEIAQEKTVPSDISDVNEALPTLMMEAWNQELTPAERRTLGCLLPDAQRDDSAVMSIFRGGTSRFGIDRAGNLWKSVCEGKETPDAALQRESERERELKTLESHYLKDLEKYHKGFIENAERFKWLWSDICKRDDQMFFELIGNDKSKFA